MIQCGITEKTSEDEDDIMNEAFIGLLNELANSEYDMTVKIYVDFDVKTSSSLLAINSDMVDWRVISPKTCVTKYLRKECSDLNEVALDKDDANNKDVKVVEISAGEVLRMLDRLVNPKDLSKEERNSHRKKIQIREDKSAEQKAKPYQ